MPESMNKYRGVGVANTEQRSNKVYLDKPTPVTSEERRADTTAI